MELNKITDRRFSEFIFSLIFSKVFFWLSAAGLLVRHKFYMLYASTVHIKTKVSIYQNKNKTQQNHNKLKKNRKILVLVCCVFMCFDLFCLFFNYVFVVNLF